MSEANEYAGPERRDGKQGWTLWKEIYGTLIGTMPFVVMLIVWGSSVQNRLAILEIEVQHSKQMADADRASARDERQAAGQKLDRIIDQIATLQQQVARQSATRLVP